jgi:TPR repeat protein
MYLIVLTFFNLICLLAKLGVAKEFCRGLKIHRDYSAGLSAYERKNYDECFKIYKPYIDCKEDECSGIKYTLGLMYYYGQGVNVDRKKALELFGESAALGDIGASLFLKQFKVRTHEKT